MGRYRENLFENLSRRGELRRNREFLLQYHHQLRASHREFHRPVRRPGNVVVLEFRRWQYLGVTKSFTYLHDKRNLHGSVDRELGNLHPYRNKDSLYHRLRHAGSRICRRAHLGRFAANRQFYGSIDWRADSVVVEFWRWQYFDGEKSLASIRCRRNVYRDIDRHECLRNRCGNQKQLYHRQ